MTYTVETVEVGGNPMPVLVFLPLEAGAGQAPVPGVVVAQHLPVAHAGLEGDAFTIDVGEKLAAAGYACAIPWLFHWWPADADVAVKREQYRDDNAVEDLRAAGEVLAGLGRVDAERMSILGHCWGGRIALLGACHDLGYKAAVMLYGGRLRQGLGEGAPPPIEMVDRIRCPVLGIFGNEDQNPSPADVDDLDAALTAAGVAHEFHRYDGAGHGFQTFDNPERYRPEAAKDAWQKIVAFLKRTL
jgi:carboxymethylenebutenolidase